MATKSTMATNFKPETVKEVFSKVKGHSSIVKLAKQMPVAFSGNDIMTFNLDGEVAIVGEGQNKPAGEATIAPITVNPVKVVYQHRVSDEFLRASEEKALKSALEWAGEAALCIIEHGISETANRYNGKQ